MLGVEVVRESFLTLALDEGEWSALSSGRFNPGKNPDTHSTGGKVLQIIIHSVVALLNI
jgi:hypothetical protein